MQYGRAISFIVQRKQINGSGNAKNETKLSHMQKWGSPKKTREAPKNRPTESKRGGHRQPSGETAWSPARNTRPIRNWSRDLSHYLGVPTIWRLELEAISTCAVWRRARHKREVWARCLDFQELTKSTFEREENSSILATQSLRDMSGPEPESIRGNGLLMTSSS